MGGFVALAFGKSSSPTLEEVRKDYASRVVALKKIKSFKAKKSFLKAWYASANEVTRGITPLNIEKPGMEALSLMVEDFRYYLEILQETNGKPASCEAARTRMRTSVDPTREEVGEGQFSEGAKAGLQALAILCNNPKLAELK